MFFEYTGWQVVLYYTAYCVCQTRPPSAFHNGIQLCKLQCWLIFPCSYSMTELRRPLAVLLTRRWNWKIVEEPRLRPVAYGALFHSIWASFPCEDAGYSSGSGYILLVVLMEHSTSLVLLIHFILMRKAIGLTCHEMASRLSARYRRILLILLVFVNVPG